MQIECVGTGMNTDSLMEEAIRRKEAAEKVKAPYEAIWVVFDQLKGKLDDALRNATRLAFENAAMGEPRRNPSTFVHELIKALREHDPAKQMA